MITDKAKEITNIIYNAYGSHSGYLFGLSPEQREAVEAIVQSTIDELGGKQMGDKYTPTKNCKKCKLKSCLGCRHWKSRVHSTK